MPIPLRFLGTDPPSPRDYTPGDCWYDSHRSTEGLSTEYQSLKRERLPIVVCLPHSNGNGGFPFCIDMAAKSEKEHGWTVTGSIEDSSLTVRPSIDCSPDFHGWITSGVIYPLGQS